MKKTISVLLALIMVLSVMSSLGVCVNATFYRQFYCGEEYLVESGTNFFFRAQESGAYEFTSYDNFDPRLTVEFSDGSVIVYDDVDFDNLDYEFSCIIELEAGEEIFCTVEDGENNDVSFYIERYYEVLSADEEYQVATDYQFKFVAEEMGTYEFYSFDNADPVLKVVYEDGTVEIFDDISEDNCEFNVLLALSEGEEIICTVADYEEFYVNFGIRAYGNLEADVDYTADAGYDFFFTANEDGYYRFVSFENEGDPFIEITVNGEEITFDDCYDSYEFDGGLYLDAGDYIYAIVDDNYRTEDDEYVVNFCIEYWADECPGHYESDCYIGEDASVYSAGWFYTECTLCGEELFVGEIPQLKPATPKLTKIANTASGVQVTWGAVEGADNYVVYRKTYDAKTKKWSGWTNLGKTTSASYVDKTAKSGTYYLYTVKAVNEAGASGYDKTGIKTYFLARPTVTTANANAGVTVKWTKATGATGYIVYRKTTGGWTKVATVKGAGTLSYTDKTAKAGTTYKYTVKAYYGSYVSAYNTSGVAVRRLTTPTLKSVTSAKAGVTTKWNKVTGASGYIVYRKTGNGGWVKLATVSGNSKITYLDKTAKKGVTYTYTVKAYYGSSTSAHNTKGLTIKDKY